MKSKNTNLTFEGQKVYVGIDVHLAREHSKAVSPFEPLGV